MSNQFFKMFIVWFFVFLIKESFAPKNDSTFFLIFNHSINISISTIAINRNIHRHVKTSLLVNSIHCRCWYFFPHSTKTCCVLSVVSPSCNRYFYYYCTEKMTVKIRTHSLCCLDVDAGSFIEQQRESCLNAFFADYPWGQIRRNVLLPIPYYLFSTKQFQIYDIIHTIWWLSIPYVLAYCV